jgi:CheY-like chemotaxis protein
MPILEDESSSPPRIAVVDDDPLIVRAVLRILARTVPDAECRSAHDGFSAGALLTSFRPELVFLDVVMPGMSGGDVCAHIRATPELAGTAVVIVSAHLTAKLERELLAVGADRLIAKPFRAADIESAVAELVKPWTPAGAVTRTARPVNEVGA